jgi:hypothetical protein
LWDLMPAEQIGISLKFQWRKFVNSSIERNKRVCPLQK